MAYDAVLGFLEDHNRPFSVNEIQQGVKSDFGKSAIQKALDSLVENEEVKEKIYGKQKVYYIVQKNGASSSEIRETLLETDRKINERILQLHDITAKVKNYSYDISQLKGTITLKDAVDQKLQLEKEFEGVTSQLERYSGVQVICSKKKVSAEREYEKYLSEYRKRKRMCLDIVDSILENYPKSKKHFFEDVGIETDEGAGFAFDRP